MLLNLLFTIFYAFLWLMAGFELRHGTQPPWLFQLLAIAGLVMFLFHLSRMLARCTQLWARHHKKADPNG